MTLLWGLDFRSTVDPRTPARRKTDQATLEKDWQNEVIGFARELGWRHLYHHRPALVGKPGNRRMITSTLPEGVGWPDLVCVRAGTMVVLELKRENNRPAARQVEWLEALAEVPGVVVLYARPRDRRLVYDVLSTPWKYLGSSDAR